MSLDALSEIITHGMKALQWLYSTAPLSTSQAPFTQVIPLYLHIIPIPNILYLHLYLVPYICALCLSVYLEVYLCLILLCLDNRAGVHGGVSRTHVLADTLVKDCLFDSNYAGEDGGAFSVYNKSNIEIFDSSFTSKANKF